VNPPVDIKGLVVGQLTVLEFSRKKSGGQRLWRCLCTCGNEHFANSYKLRKGLVNKCTACWKKETATRQTKKRRLLPGGFDIYDVAARLGLTRSAVHMRILRGWAPEEAAKWERRRQKITLHIPCHLCGTDLPKDPIHPFPGKGPVCRGCFIEWDKADELEMFNAMAIPALEIPEDPDDFGEPSPATASTGGYQGEGTSGKTQWRGEFGPEKTVLPMANRPNCQRCGAEHEGSVRVDGDLMLCMCHPCHDLWMKSPQRAAIHATLNGFMGRKTPQDPNQPHVETPDEREARIRNEILSQPQYQKGMRKK
jgi:hypothetical protein